MKTCSWCEKEMKKQNYNKHVKRCSIKKTTNMKKSEIENLKEKLKSFELNKNVQFAYSELRDYLTDCYNKSFLLYNKLVEHNEVRDPIEKIKEMQISEGTVINYIGEWKRYSLWCDKNNKVVGKESADTYLASLDEIRPSTLRQKQHNLQILLQHLISPALKLNKIRKRISFIPKYALSNDEIKEYLKEQKKINLEDYLIQKFMITYCIRINSAALLKFKNLEFLRSGKYENIYIPDSKVKRARTEKISSQLRSLFTEFLEHKGKRIRDYEDEDYIFYRYGSGESERVRAHKLCVRINKRIRKSKVLAKSKNFKYTSHMFRKTKAFNFFQTEVEKLKEQVRSSIGQSSGSTAVDSYIY